MSKSSGVKLYFISNKNETIWKLGISHDPTHRLATIQCDNPETLFLRLICVVPNIYRTEKTLHEALSAFRIRGEWFKIEPAMLFDRIGHILHGIGLHNCAPIESDQATLELIKTQRVKLVREIPQGGLLTISEIASWMNCPEVVLRRAIKSGRIPAFVVGPRMLRFDRVDIERIFRYDAANRGLKALG